MAGREEAAVFLAQVFTQVCHVQQFFWVQVGVVVGGQNDVGTCAGVGGHSSLGANVFPTFVVNTNFNASEFCELLDIGHVGVNVALHKTAPAQNAQLGTFFRLEAEVLRMDRWADGHGPHAQCSGSCRNAG